MTDRRPAESLGSRRDDRLQYLPTLTGSDWKQKADARLAAHTRLAAEILTAADSWIDSAGADSPRAALASLAAYAINLGLGFGGGNWSDFGELVEDAYARDLMPEDLYNAICRFMSELV